LSAPIGLDELLVHVIDAARDVLRADRGTVFLYDRKSDELFIKVATGVQDIRFPASRGIAGECAQSRRVVNVPDCYADTRFNPEVDRKTGYRTRCLLTVPLVGVDDQLVGVMQVLNKQSGVFDDTDERIATALASQAAVALQRAVLIEEQIVKKKLERDLDIAKEIQQGLWPEKMPDIAGYDIAGWSRPTDQTGGDIYDVLPLDAHGAMLLLGDATGHGVGPAISVTQVRAMLRMAVRLEADLDRTFTQINEQLCEDLSAHRFVTAFVGLLDSIGHQVIYHSGGQGPILHFHADTGACDKIEASTFPLGIIAGHQPERPAPIRLAPGDILALVSDGIFEQQNDAGEQFGDERTIALIRDNQHRPMAELIPIIDEQVLRFAGSRHQLDDMTILLVKRTR
jgi:phosphoserine phosphatase